MPNKKKISVVFNKTPKDDLDLAKKRRKDVFKGWLEDEK